MKDLFKILMAIICSVPFILVFIYILSWVYFFVWTYVAILAPASVHWGDRDPQAMFDKAVVQYVEDRIPIGSNASVIETFIEQEKEEWPYHITPSGNFEPYYTLTYKKGIFDSWLGKSYGTIYIFLDKQDSVTKIELKRSIQPMP